MTELKTLKDLKDFEKIDLDGEDYEAGYVKVEDLKQEAIKWVKSKKQYWPSTDNWIKHFFNITEEDLK